MLVSAQNGANSMELKVHRRREILGLASAMLVLLGAKGFTGPPFFVEGRTVQEWTRSLRNGSPEDRQRAAWILGRYAPETDAALSALGTALRDPDDGVRQAALWSIEQFGTRAAKLTPALIERLKNGFPDARGNVAAAIGGIGPQARAAEPALIERLKDSDGIVRCNSALALGRIGAGAPGIAALAEALHDHDGLVQVQAALALWQLGRKPPEIALLTSLLGDPDALTASLAASALRQMGPEARAAVPALRQALASGHGMVSLGAAEALWRINQDSSAIPALTKMLSEDSAAREAASALDRIGPMARQSLPSLRLALRSKDRCLRATAAKAIWSIEKSPLALEELVRGLDGNDPSSRSLSALYLGEIGSDARVAIPTLEKTLHDSDGLVRARTWQALRKIRKSKQARVLRSVASTVA
jgi:HEAT repeat protein